MFIQTTLPERRFWRWLEAIAKQEIIADPTSRIEFALAHSQFDAEKVWWEKELIWN